MPTVIHSMLPGSSPRHITANPGMTPISVHVRPTTTLMQNAQADGKPLTDCCPWCLNIEPQTTVSVHCVAPLRPNTSCDSLEATQGLLLRQLVNRSTWRWGPVHNDKYHSNNSSAAAGQEAKICPWGIRLPGPAVDWNCKKGHFSHSQTALLIDHCTSVTPPTAFIKCSSYSWRAGLSTNESSVTNVLLLYQMKPLKEQKLSCRPRHDGPRHTITTMIKSTGDKLSLENKN